MRTRIVCTPWTNASKHHLLASKYSFRVFRKKFVGYKYAVVILPSIKYLNKVFVFVQGVLVR